MSINKKLPPYAKSIPNNQDCVVICTGSDAWRRAKSKGWLNGLTKTLLPLNDEIDAYRWDFTYNKDVLLFSNGILETYERLIELSRALLAHGALRITWFIPEFHATTFLVSKEVSA